MNTLFTICIAVCIIFVFLVSIAFLIYTYTSTGQYKLTIHKEGDYEVVEIHGLLSDDECDTIKDMAIVKGLEESMVWNYGEQTGNTLIKDHRKSKQFWLEDKTSAVTMKIARITERLTGIPISHQEMLQVAMYEAGGMFNEHYDACDHEDDEYCAKMNNNSGQRRATLLIYLNDDFEGGETEFVNMGIKVKPEKGKAILFWNTTNDESIIPMSKHKGCEVRSGEKWICTKWTHSSPYKQ